MTADKVVFRVLTWNIGGLDTSPGFDKRLLAIIACISELKPDFCLLQEVSNSQLSCITTQLGDRYSCQLQHCAFSYRALILSLTDSWQVLSTHQESFIHSIMGRGIVAVCAQSLTAPRRPFLVATVHLESGAASKSRRMAQLEQALRFCAVHEGPFILGGDLNIRDREVKCLSEFPEVVDLWEICGRPEASRYTWDLKYNHNQRMPQTHKSKFIRYRFDRLLSNVKTAENFRLVGTKKIVSGMFPSDHFGVLVSLQL